MNLRITSARIQRFKTINDAPFDAAPINVFIGANNSGKSTLAQMLHFGIGVLQAITLADRWTNSDTLSVSLSPDQLLYAPSVDLYSLGYNGRLLEPREQAIVLSLKVSDGAEITLEVRKGRNGNILVRVDNAQDAKRLSSVKEPFTIYSPGLAGIARNESYISNGVLLRTIARGDANLVLRNILLRLQDDGNSDRWDAFVMDLEKLFPDISIEVQYDKDTDEDILVYADTGGGRVPIELAGTGVLQAVQILSYVHYFHPSVIILDEPDSHLHPNNQRILCKLLQGVAEDRDTQVFLTTHSRHVVDVLGGQASFLWVRSGTVERIDQDYDLAVLLDIGALDARELILQSHARCIVLTEDTLKLGLEVLLESSGFPKDKTLVLSYHGCTDPHNLRPLLDLIRGSNQDAKIVVHRDRDYLAPEEAAEWEKRINAMGAEPFLTEGVDIESHYLNPIHLCEVNGKDEEYFVELIDVCTKAVNATSLEKYVNGRVDIMRKQGKGGEINLGQLAVTASKVVESNIARYRHSKSVLKLMRQRFKDETGLNLSVTRPSEVLCVPSLEVVAKKL